MKSYLFIFMNGKSMILAILGPNLKCDKGFWFSKLTWALYHSKLHFALLDEAQTEIHKDFVY